MIISLKEGCTRFEVEHKLCNLLIPLYKAIGCLFVCPFFLSIKSKCSGQLLFGPLITKKIFFSTQPFPLWNRGAKINFLGISITPKPFNGFSSKFLEGCYVGYCQKPSCKKFTFYLPPQQRNHATSLKIRRIWIFAFLCANSSQTA